MSSQETDGCRTVEVAEAATVGVEVSLEEAQDMMKKDAGATRDLDEEIAMMQVPNTSFQPQENDGTILKMTGGSKVIKTEANRVPSLCTKWVLLECPCTANTCKQRHYYVSNEERDKMVAYRQEHDAKLEKTVLNAITVREETLKRLETAATDSTRRFQEHTREVQEEDVSSLLEVLDQARLVTVKCVETISRWRKCKEKSGLAQLAQSTANTGESKKIAAGVAVTLTVDGEKLYNASSSFQPKLSRFRRDAEAAKVQKVHKYLGVCETKDEAERMYDKAIGKEAVRLMLPVSLMPQRRFVIRSCGLHYAIESVGTKRKSCEQCKAAEYSGKATYSPAFMWNGRNYLLKIGNDMDFMATCEPLVRWLGSVFPLTRNPFLLTASLEDAKREEVERSKKESEEAIARQAGRSSTSAGGTGGLHSKSSTSPSGSLESSHDRILRSQTPTHKNNQTLPALSLNMMPSGIGSKTVSFLGHSASTGGVHQNGLPPLHESLGRTVQYSASTSALHGTLGATVGPGGMSQQVHNVVSFVVPHLDIFVSSVLVPF